MIKVILTLSLIHSILFSFEISKNMTFSKELRPTIMSSTITAIIKDKDKLKIQELFKEVIKISSDEKICTDGSYSISPHYKYIRKKDGLSENIFDGYTGRINFECKFKDTKKIDNIISKMDKVSSKKDKLKLTLNPISWILEEEISKKEIDKLELEALNYTKSYTRYLSDIYSKKCAVKRVDLYNSSNIRLRSMPREDMAMMKNSITTEPINKDLTLKYSAAYLFSCED